MAPSSCRKELSSSTWLPAAFARSFPPQHGSQGLLRGAFLLSMAPSSFREELSSSTWLPAAFARSFFSRDGSRVVKSAGESPQRRGYSLSWRVGRARAQLSTRRPRLTRKIRHPDRQRSQRTLAAGRCPLPLNGIDHFSLSSEAIGCFSRTSLPAGLQFLPVGRQADK
jgi:hypothetical protein